MRQYKINMFSGFQDLENYLLELEEINRYKFGEFLLEYMDCNIPLELNYTTTDERFIIIINNEKLFSFSSKALDIEIHIDMIKLYLDEFLRYKYIL